MLVTRIGAYLAVIFLFLPLGHGVRLPRRAARRLRRLHGRHPSPRTTRGCRSSPHDSKVDFLRRQVLTSRNIKGNWVMDTFMGGLNYQIEHHLFPNMPRPHLAQGAARSRGNTAQTHKHPLHRDDARRSRTASSSQYLNRVGLAAGGDPFDCPAATQFGR